MGLPSEGGPDLIFRRGRDDATVPWKRLVTIAIVVVWGLFVLMPYRFADDPSRDALTRWTAVALIAILLTLSLPPLLSSGRRGAAMGVAIAAAVTIALAWVFTA